ncbi:MAG: hypothetical protein H6978_03425 [Gammaproteobacteria bacterium]|nr:hypothetical protein [Gammaproteobacteria bacterium]
MRAKLRQIDAAQFGTGAHLRTLETPPTWKPLIVTAPTPKTSMAIAPHIQRELCWQVSAEAAVHVALHDGPVHRVRQ